MLRLLLWSRFVPLPGVGLNRSAGDGPLSSELLSAEFASLQEPHDLSIGEISDLSGFGRADDIIHRLHPLLFFTKRLYLQKEK